jgi:hypothetical protein
VSEIKAIETRYKGFHFRSRLEARWAVFFDAMNWEWRYEPQGYDIGGEWYLPDFWVDGLGWVEVKGSLDSLGAARLLDAARNLPQDLEGRQGPRGRHLRAVDPKLVILSDIPDPSGPWAHVELGVDTAGAVRWRMAHMGGPGAAMLPYTEWLSVPPKLGSFAAWIAGRSASYVRPLKGIPAACTAARSARFEHGQKGAA